MKKRYVSLFFSIAITGLFSCSGIFSRGKADSAASMQHLEKAKKYEERWQLNKDTASLLKAREIYFRAAEINPGNYDAWNDVGSSYVNSGDVERSIPYFRHAISLRKDFGFAWFNLGVTYYSLERKDSAWYCFRTSSVCNPKYETGWDMLVRMAEEKGQADSVLFYSRKAAESNPESYAAWDRLAWKCFQSGDTAGSVAAGEKAVEIEPWHKDKVMNLKNYFQYHGNTAKADYYQRMLETN